MQGRALEGAQERHGAEASRAARAAGAEAPRRCPSLRRPAARRRLRQSCRVPHQLSAVSKAPSARTRSLQISLEFAVLGLALRLRRPAPQHGQEAVSRGAGSDRGYWSSPLAAARSELGMVRRLRGRGAIRASRLCLRQLAPLRPAADHPHLPNPPPPPTRASVTTLGRRAPEGGPAPPAAAVKHVTLDLAALESSEAAAAALAGADAVFCALGTTRAVRRPAVPPAAAAALYVPVNTACTVFGIIT